MMTQQTADHMMDRLAHEVADFRRLYPAADYAGRFYHCSACSSVHACAAPRVDLIDAYPCPECGRAQQPWTPAHAPGPARRSRSFKGL
jgi:hypothetical protein